MEKEEILDYTERQGFLISHGKMFPSTMVFLAILGALLGMGILITLLNVIGLLVFLFLLGVMVYVGFSRTGIQFSYTTREVRQYVDSFFRRSGNWKNLDSYNHIALLSSKKVQRYNHGFVTGASNSAKFVTYDVYLLDKNHYKKILVNSFESKEEAKEMINKLVEKLDLNYTVYAPKRISKRR